MNPLVPQQQQQQICKLQLLLLLMAAMSRRLQSTTSSSLLCSPKSCPSPLADAAQNPPINVSFPFGTQLDCGASSAFLLTNDCQHQDLRWPGFLNAINASAENDGNLPESSPFVLGIGNQSVSCFADGFTGSIDIAWNVTLAALHADSGSSDIYRHFICNPPSVDRIPQYLGSSFTINLNRLQVIRGYADSSLFLDSDTTHLLLFNCTAPASQIDESTWERNDSACQNYTQNTQECDSNDTMRKLEATNCIRLRPCNNLTHRNIDVSEWMREMNCTHFQIMRRSNSSGSSGAAAAAELGTMRLRFNPDHPLCPYCTRTGGECGYENATSLENFQCYCPDGTQALLRCGPPPVAVAVCICAIAIAFMLLLRPKTANHNHLDLASVKEFSYKELSSATGDFECDNLIGQGGSGSVYLGVLQTGQKVAIKRLYCDDFRRLDQFHNEMMILSRLQHPNLIKLYGFCSQPENNLLLVFEYAPNGTVWDQLHNKQEEEEGGEHQLESSSFPWQLRLRIARETADALSYMHNSIHPPICHRDVKTTNILLDEHFHAKVADFGLSRLVPCGATHVTTGPQGSPGYVDPDYQSSYQLTDKSDVYSFGVVLVELVSAKPAVDLSRKRAEINLSNMAKAKMASGAWDELLDPSLQMMHHNPHMESSIKAVLELALTCLDEEKEHRPTMQQVAKALADIYGAQDPNLLD